MCIATGHAAMMWHVMCTLGDPWSSDSYMLLKLTAEDTNARHPGHVTSPNGIACARKVGGCDMPLAACTQWTRNHACQDGWAEIARTAGMRNCC